MNDNLTPKAIVAALDEHIIGQNDAKKAVAVALRNRWRRQRLSPDLREEVTPKNILMIGPTGCGKTEISRRLAKLADAPFVKVEATKFTEVGYVGRDVEQIARDLMEVSLEMARERLRKDVKAKAELAPLSLAHIEEETALGVSRMGNPHQVVALIGQREAEPAGGVREHLTAPLAGDLYLGTLQRTELDISDDTVDAGPLAFHHYRR